MVEIDNRETFYAVVPFKRARGGIAIGATVMAKGREDAVRLAERLASANLGAVAFSRTGDPEAAEFDEPVELARYGQVPENLAEMMAA